MKLELLTIAAVYSFYMLAEKGNYTASWRVHLFAILIPILILKFIKNIDPIVRLFVITILFWHIVDVLNIAIAEPKNNDTMVHRHANPESDASGVVSGVGEATEKISQ